MASEDVIELGSSEDEAEPAPKKMKPTPNAMVHIPCKLPNVTMTSVTSHTGRTGSPAVKLAGKGITIKKVVPSNGRNGPLMKPNSLGLMRPNPIKPNPLGLMKKINNSQIVVNRIRNHKIPAVVHKYSNTAIRVIPPQNIKIPPNITIKRTVVSKHSGIRPITAINLPNTHKIPNKFAPKKTIKVSQPKLQKKPVIGEVLTVELDDDEESGTSTANPKWYIHPEDHAVAKEEANIQDENNQEPEGKKMIEITIEDSPIKQIISKKSELAITIEDSPIKPNSLQQDKGEASDDDTKAKKTEKQSKKKLHYTNTVEIEVDPIYVAPDPQIIENLGVDKIIEIEESPYKDITDNSTTPKKKQQLNAVNSVNLNSLKETGEFHPVYQNFIALCFELENSDDMKKIVEKKIKAYYRQVPKEYTHSESFIDLISCKITCMKASPDKMYLYIKDIVDELNLQRKSAKAQINEAEEKKEEVQNYLYGQDSEFDSKRQRQIRKLEKTLKKLHRAVQKLEEQEVDFDDDEDSVYLLTERYKERMVKVHAKFCQLTNTKMPSEPRVQIDARPGQPSGPAKRLEKWINKKVPIGTPLPFPDFHDVIRCVREANEEDKLGWNEVVIMEEARDLFTRCGKKLQRRRQENEWRSAASRISVEIDPAEKDDDLKKRLEQNRQFASKRENEVFNKYAIKQSQMNLEPEEIGDKEADESPIESEEEDHNDNESLENTEKRKGRLRKLLQQKSRNNPTNVLNVNNERSKLPCKDNIVEMTQVESKDKEKDPLQETNKMDVEEICKDNTTTDKTVMDNTDPRSTKNIENPNNNEESDNIDSDIDELHLLQKLHSENEVSNSTLETSDSESPINISDTLSSSSDIENKHNSCSEVISIENSSYSESEIIEEKNLTEASDSPKAVGEHVMDIGGEIECSNDGIEKHRVHSNNEEYCEPVEDILLESSDDEHSTQTEVIQNDGNYINSKDDSLSISSTGVEGVDQNSDVANNSQEISEKINSIKTNNTWPLVPVHSPEKDTEDITSKRSQIIKGIESIEKQIASVKSNEAILVTAVEVINDVIEKEATDSCVTDISAVTESGSVNIESNSKTLADTNLDSEHTNAPGAVLCNETEVH